MDTKLFYTSIQSFSLATGLPLFITKNEESIIKFPEHNMTINDAICRPRAYEYIHNDYTVSKYNEHFWSYQMEEYQIILGPVFFEKVVAFEEVRLQEQLSDYSQIALKRKYTRFKKTCVITDKNHFFHSVQMLKQIIKPVALITDNSTSLPKFSTLQFIENCDTDQSDSLEFESESLYTLNKQLCEDIKNQYYNSAETTLNQIIAIVLDAPIEDQRFYLYQLCNDLTRVTIDLNQQIIPLQLLSKKWMLRIDSLNELHQFDLNIIAQSLFADFSAVFKDKKNERIHPTVQRALLYIDEHIFDKITLKQLADFASVHQNYLSRLFQDELGKTITYVINEKKIQLSCHLIVHTKKSIAAISAQLNFCNSAYFHKCFKRIMKRSPSEHRTLYSKNYAISHLLTNN